MYLVTVVKDIYEESAGVEIAGMFDTEEKAYKAKAIIVKYLEEEGYEDYKIFVSQPEVNKLSYYNITNFIE